MSLMKIGTEVKYQGKIYTVLGYTASKDEDDNQMMEIAWNDYELSPESGYLGVSMKELVITGLLDMNGTMVRVGDVVDVYGLKGPCSHEHMVGTGKVYNLSGIPSAPQGMFWVSDIGSCYHPDACILKYKKELL